MLQVPGRGPDLEGSFADASGAPVSLAYLDLAPLDSGGVGQQERSDADGKFAVFQMPAGRYRVTAYVPGRGVLSTIVNVPQKNVRLTLGGTGRVTGTAKGITHGSFELRLTSCVADGRAISIADDIRIVGVLDGKFAIDGLPICELGVIAMHRGRAMHSEVVVPASGAGTLEFTFEEEIRDDGPH